jgi:cation:H+ antiporter
MSAFLPYILLVAGFAILIKGADWLVDGSSSLAKSLNVSDLVIGLTVVAFGTSSPELFVNILASYEGRPEIAIGNILGSNIFNILAILGLSAMIYPITVQSNTVWKEIPFSLLAALVAGVVANDVLIAGQDRSAIDRVDGLVLLLFFAVFMYYVLDVARNNPQPADSEYKRLPGWKAVLFIVVGLAMLVLGGRWIVDSAVQIAQAFSVSEKLIGVTIVAIGTSLPELATSLIAARKKNSDIAVGNVVGSNIFNIFFILGTSSLILPLPIQSTSNVDLLMTVFASVLLFVVMFIGRKHILHRWEGLTFLGVYVLYVIYTVMAG